MITFGHLQYLGNYAHPPMQSFLEAPLPLIRSNEDLPLIGSMPWQAAFIKDILN